MSRACSQFLPTFVPVLAILAASVAAQQQPAPAKSSPKPVAAKPAPSKPVAMGLTNADVIKMVQAGLGESIVLATVRGAEKTNFDITPDGLIALKKSGVSDTIVAALINPAVVSTPAAPAPAPSAPVASAAVPAPAASDAATAREPGIYAVVAGKFVEMDSTPVTSGGVGAGSVITSGLTMGFKKIKVKAQIRGAEANLRLSDAPEFYFLGSGYNANEFVLARLERGDSNREIIIGQAGALGMRSGIRDEDQLGVKVEKVSSGVYKVSATRDLRPGEYAFIKIADDKDRRLWDFGVDR